MAREQKRNWQVTVFFSVRSGHRDSRLFVSYGRMREVLNRALRRFLGTHYLGVGPDSILAVTIEGTPISPLPSEWRER